jgi:PAS domain S-box-containing protein
MILFQIFSTWGQKIGSARFYYLAFQVCLLFWTVFFGIEIAFTSLDIKLIMVNIQFIGIEFLPVAWLGFVLNYVEHPPCIKRLLPFLTIVPITSQIVIWTNPLHHLFQGNPSLDFLSTDFNVVANDYQIWYFLVQMPVVYIIFLATLFMLFRAYRNSVGAYRYQIRLLLIATIIPLLVSLLYVFKISLIPHFNMTVLFFSLSGIILTINLFKHHFLDLMPVARSKLVENMRDGWIVLDEAGRFVDLNQNAQTIIGLDSNKLIGHKASLIFTGNPVLAKCFEAQDSYQTELQLLVINATRTFDFQLTPLYTKNGRLNGRLAVIRDITRRVEMEKERDKLIDELQDALAQVKILQGLLPICANCHNIRDDQGYWHRVEAYIEKHSQARFSHDICPDCIRQLYPEVAKELLNN